MSLSRRKEQKAATRQAVKDAAYGCFAEKGYAATQVGDICRAAGVAQGTFYVHFPSKEDVLEELLQDFNVELVELVQPKWPGGVPADGEALVRSIARAFFRHWRRNRGLVAAYAERAALGTSLERLRDGANPPMLDFLTRSLVAAGEVVGGVAVRADLVTQGLLALWLRIGLQVLFNDSVREEDAQEVLVKMTLGALRGVMPGLGGKEV
jgi:AcrR family transcriptional regulator